MTKELIGQDIAKQIAGQLPEAVVESSESCVYIKPELIIDVIRFLKTAPELKINFLNCITGIDYLDRLEVVYHLSSLELHHMMVLKVRCDRDNAEMPSLYHEFRGADYQEREIYDLIGVKFTGHPNMRRLFMWEGFEGHPLRRDYL